MSTDIVSLASVLCQRNSTGDDIIKLTNDIIKLCHNEDTVQTALSALTAIIMEENAGLVQKQLFLDVIDGLKPPVPFQNIKNVSQTVLTLLLSRSIAYEDVIRKLRLLLSECYEQEGDFAKASDVLLPGVSDTALRPSPERAALFLRLTNLCLLSNKVDEAEQVINRVSLIQFEIDQESLARYNYLSGLILDYRGKYVDAASRFYPLSTNSFLTPVERREVLKKAMTCIVLSPDSPIRRRILPSIVSDDRCRNIEGYKLIEKMFMNRLITQTDEADFETLLEPHHRVTDQTGKVSPLPKFVLEHNIVAISKLFRNIHFNKLSNLLKMPVDVVQRTITEMVIQDRLVCTIDQATDTVFFNTSNDPNAIYDHFFLTACQESNAIYDQISRGHNAWFKQTFPELN